MNGVFQPVTMIDTIIFWKVEDLLMWQTTVWETLNLHNSHCFQLNAWHDSSAHWKRGGGEDTSSNLWWWTQSFPSEQRVRYRQAGEIRDKKIWRGLEIEIAAVWVNRLGSIKLCFADGLSWSHSAAEQRLGWALADPAGRAVWSPFPPPELLRSALRLGFSQHIHQINTKQLSKTVSNWELIFNYTFVDFF